MCVGWGGVFGGGIRFVYFNNNNEAKYVQKDSRVLSNHVLCYNYLFDINLGSIAGAKHLAN